MDEFFIYNIPIESAEASPDAAAEVLLAIAKILRAGDPLPRNAANYLADAFEAAMAKPVEKRAASLAVELKLKALNRRPADVEPEWLYGYTELSETEGKKRIAKKYGISPSTALKKLKMAKISKEAEMIEAIELITIMEEDYKQTRKKK